MITATYKNRYGHTNTVKVDHLVNRGDWWGKTWLLEIGLGFSSVFYVVEGDNETDVIDTFADSKHSHMIDDDNICEFCEEDDFDNCTCTFAGNDGHRVNLDNVMLHRCKLNYFAKNEVK